MVTREEVRCSGDLFTLCKEPLGHGCAGRIAFFTQLLIAPKELLRTEHQTVLSFNDLYTSSQSVIRKLVSIRPCCDCGKAVRSIPLIFFRGSLRDDRYKMSVYVIRERFGNNV